MELRNPNGEIVPINAAEQTDGGLLDALAEIQNELEERGYDMTIGGPLGVIAARGKMAEDAGVERDRLALAETTFRQLEPAFAAYQTVVGHLNRGRGAETRHDTADQTTLEAALRRWLTADKLTFMANEVSRNPDLRFTLVVTPNVLATGDDVARLADALSDSRIRVDSQFEELTSRYTAEQLSGAQPDNGEFARFSLIPNRPLIIKGRDRTTFTEQREELDRLRQDHPFLRAPAVLEALCYFAALREDGLELERQFPHTLTNVVHSDLPSIYWGGGLSVPQTRMIPTGGGLGVDLNYSGLANSYFGKLSIGDAP